MPQLHLLPPKRPRAKPRVMADVIDGGNEAVRVVHAKCGFDQWINNPGDRFVRKWPCPKCNEVKL